jgi:hypothetical protein
VVAVFWAESSENPWVVWVENQGNILETTAQMEVQVLNIINHNYMKWIQTIWPTTFNNNSQFAKLLWIQRMEG